MGSVERSAMSVTFSSGLMRRQVETADSAPGVSSFGYEVESSCVAAWFMRQVRYSLEIEARRFAGVSLEVNGKLMEMKSAWLKPLRDLGGMDKTRSEGLNFDLA